MYGLTEPLIMMEDATCDEKCLRFTDMSFKYLNNENVGVLFSSRVIYIYKDVSRRCEVTSLEVRGS